MPQGEQGKGGVRGGGSVRLQICVVYVGLCAGASGGWVCASASGEGGGASLGIIDLHSSRSPSC